MSLGTCLYGTAFVMYIPSKWKKYTYVSLSLLRVTYVHRVCTDSGRYAYHRYLHSWTLLFVPCLCRSARRLREALERAAQRIEGVEASSTTTTASTGPFPLPTKHRRYARILCISFRFATALCPMHPLIVVECMCVAHLCFLSYPLRRDQNPKRFGARGQYSPKYAKQTA